MRKNNWRFEALAFAKIVKQDAEQKYAQAIEKYQREREKEAKRAK